MAAPATVSSESTHERTTGRAAGKVSVDDDLQARRPAGVVCRKSIRAGCSGGETFLVISLYVPAPAFRVGVRPHPQGLSSPKTELALHSWEKIARAYHGGVSAPNPRRRLDGRRDSLSGRGRASCRHPDTREQPRTKLLLASAGAFAFVLSALKIPSVTGSCSHPTGTGLGAVLFGPSVMAVLGAIVLLFQALLLAHGGLTTLGANIMSMAVVGPWVAYGVFRLTRSLGGALDHRGLSGGDAGRSGDLSDDLRPTGAGLSRSGQRLPGRADQVRRRLRPDPDPAGRDRGSADRDRGQSVDPVQPRRSRCDWPSPTEARNDTDQSAAARRRAGAGHSAAAAAGDQGARRALRRRGRPGRGGDHRRQSGLTTPGSRHCGNRRAARSRACCSPCKPHWAPDCSATTWVCGAVRPSGARGAIASARRPMLAIDRHAWTNRWRSHHPGERLLLAGRRSAARQSRCPRSPPAP